ncbi:MAG: hypothetical protein CBARDCOR_3162 [uncultured Caballeronia sp.]|nr:MAG: hypothetical protein CBARDCOR_3162 [uncultured Caballeronia sp.]
MEQPPQHQLSQLTMPGAHRPPISSYHPDKSALRYQHQRRSHDRPQRKVRHAPLQQPSRKHPSVLAMDRFDWNETPRGRSPGLIDYIS